MVIFILSLIQGLTEFLPVSSSGHLILLPALLGWKDHSIEIDGALHLGTLFAVVCYFWRDIGALLHSFFTYILTPAKRYHPKIQQQATLGFSIIIATLPVIIVGFFLKRMGVDSVRSPLLIAGSGIFWGSLLWLVDARTKMTRGETNITLKDGFIIGLAQIFSLIPGSSRSGMCMLAGRMLGFDRKTSARYAFLLAIPAILGACILIALDAIKEGVQTPLSDLFAYLSLSFLFGMVAIHMMLKFISNHSFMVFGIYRIFLGIVTMYLMWV